MNCQSLFRLATNQFSCFLRSLLCLDPRIMFCLLSAFLLPFVYLILPA
jgi:hypothetical protein